MIAPEKTIINAGEFMRISQRPEYEGRKLELVYGVIVEEKGVDGMAGGAGGKHGESTVEITGLLRDFVKPRKLGRLTGAETCYRLHVNPDGKDLVRCPDVGFVVMDRAPEPFDENYIPFAPDLAVEVLSPGNDPSDMHDKAREYLQFGTRLVWLIDPAARTVMVYTPTGTRLLNAGDTLDGGDVLPGFGVAVREIFPV
jgi:Uma2 family endonuclease